MRNVFLDHGILSADQWAVVKKESSKSTEGVSAIIVQLGFASAQVVQDTLAQSEGTGKIDLSTVVLDADLILKIPRDFALKNKIVPLYQEKDTLTVASATALNILLLDRTSKFFPGVHKIHSLIAQESEILQVLETYPSLSGLIEGEKTQFVQTLLADAVKRRASDIHLEPQGTFVRIRYRLDGELQQIMTFHQDYWGSAVVRFKILANLNIAENRLPQNGGFNFLFQGRTIDFRLSCHPTFHGESLVIRILDKTYSLQSLDDLGYTPSQKEMLQRFLSQRDGLMVITGPTGSGKTTTLYTLLQMQNTPAKNIMTLEQPIEYHIAGLRQTEIQENFSFAEGVRSILRHDPDIILIGEVREAETAHMVFRSTMTGHQVFTTLHTRDSVSVMDRLQDLGVEGRLIADHLTCVVSQRLVRALCIHCRRERPLTHFESYLLSTHGVMVPSSIFEAVGCKQCDMTGYKGRFAVAEILWCDEELRLAFLSGMSLVNRKEMLASKGFSSLLTEGLRRCIEGKTDFREIFKAIEFPMLEVY